MIGTKNPMSNNSCFNFITTSVYLARKWEGVHFGPNPWDWDGNEICGQWSVDTPVRCVWYELYCRMIGPAFLGESFWIVLEHRKWAIDYITYMYTWLVFVFTNLSISYLVVGFLLIELICLPGLHHHIHHLWQWQWLSITIVFNLSAPLHQHPSAPHKRFKSITMFPWKPNIFQFYQKQCFAENWIL